MLPREFATCLMLKVFNWYLKQTLFNDNKPQICVFNFQTTTPLKKTSKFSLPPSYNFSFCKQETQVVQTELRKIDGLENIVVINPGESSEGILRHFNFSINGIWLLLFLLSVI